MPTSRSSHWKYSYFQGVFCQQSSGLKAWCDFVALFSPSTWSHCTWRTAAALRSAMYLRRAMVWSLSEYAQCAFRRKLERALKWVLRGDVDFGRRKCRWLGREGKVAKRQRGCCSSRVREDAMARWCLRGRCWRVDCDPGGVYSKYNALTSNSVDRGEGRMLVFRPMGGVEGRIWDWRPSPSAFACFVRGRPTPPVSHRRCPREPRRQPRHSNYIRISTVEKEYAMGLIESLYVGWHGEQE